MIIEIQKPELEALIDERMSSGEFHSVEDVLIQALKSAPGLGKKVTGEPVEKNHPMGTELVAAMQASPFNEIPLDHIGERSPVRYFAF
jgi:Arc/MetJ-type ribon-helix-helix transcriptional regulator